MGISTTSNEGGREASSSSSSSSMNMLNVLNLIAFIANVVLTYGVGTASWFGNGDNGELSAKYQTLVTPNSTAFAIWGIIFLFQGIFVIVQLLPKFRSTPIVQDGVGYKYCMVCFFQIAWTIVFAYEIIWFSVICMFGIWLSLLFILYTQYYIYLDDDDTTDTPSSMCDKLMDFWFFRFPFAVHAGWLTAASALNINVYVVSRNEPVEIQLAVGIVSLAVLHAIGVWVIFGLHKRPNYTIACVLSWANYFINVELNEPKDKIITTFSDDAISGVRLAAAAVSVILLLQILIRLVSIVANKYLIPKTKTTTSSDTSNEVKHQNNSDTDSGDHQMLDA